MSPFSYIVALSKQGIPQDQAAAANDLWVRCGLTSIQLGPKRYALHMPEET